MYRARWGLRIVTRCEFISLSRVVIRVTAGRRSCARPPSRKDVVIFRLLLGALRIAAVDFFQGLH